MEGYEYSSGNPKCWVTMKEIASLEASIEPVSACMGGGTKELYETV